MPSIVILEVVEGSPKGERFLFRDAARVLVGRSGRCDVRLPDDPLHYDVSRKHCLIDIDPPHATIRDVGSRNGTYLNGLNIGQRAPSLGPDDSLAALSQPLSLSDGDLIGVGHTIFRVDIRPGAEGADDETLCTEHEPMLVG